MSESDNFINEVTDEVRRDALFTYIRRYGWIALLLVFVLVGGAAYNEYTKAQATNAARDAGDAILTSLEADDDATRIAGLTANEIDGPARVINQLLLANAQIDAGQDADARATLNAIAVAADTPQIYRDLAALKAAMLPSDDADARAAALETLAQPGAPFALLAQEQLALIAAEDADKTDAIAQFERIAEDAGASQGLRERAQAMIVALGGTAQAEQE